MVKMSSMLLTKVVVVKEDSRRCKWLDKWEEFVFSVISTFQGHSSSDKVLNISQVEV